MILECTANEGFEDQITPSEIYEIKMIGQNSVLIENDKGVQRWYGQHHFEFRLPE